MVLAHDTKTFFPLLQLAASRAGSDAVFSLETVREATFVTPVTDIRSCLFLTCLIKPVALKTKLELNKHPQRNLEVSRVVQRVCF